jgi:hypothetical protein
MIAQYIRLPQPSLMQNLNDDSVIDRKMNISLLNNVHR